MLLELKYIVAYVRGLMAHTDATWQSLAKGDLKESKPDYMMAHYYWPLFGISATLILLLIGYGGLFGEGGITAFDLEKGMKAMVKFVVIYAVGPMLITLLSGPVLHYTLSVGLKRDKVDVFVHYTMSTLMVLEVCCAVFPNLEFLLFSQLYVIYIIAEGVDYYLNIEKNARAVATVLFSLIFWLAPRIITFLFNFFDKL